jgi:hypothetical protein
MLKNVFAVALLGTLGCANTIMVPVVIESSPAGLPLDVDGMAAGATPVEVELSCERRWAGVGMATGGWEGLGPIHRITVNGHPGPRTKRVNACNIEAPPGKIRFEFPEARDVSHPVD